MKKITKDSTLKEIMKIKGAEEILRKGGVPCVSCPMAQMELEFLKLGEVCERYGIKVEKVLGELNRGKGMEKKEVS